MHNVFHVAPPRARTLVAASAIFGLLLTLSISTSANADPAGTATPPQIVPAPVSMTTGTGQFALTNKTRIVVSSGADAIGQLLQAGLKPSTGFPLPVTSETAASGDISITLGSPSTLSGGQLEEGYQLNVTSDGVSLVAKTVHGLFNGVQTIEQMLPAWISSPTLRSGPWTMSAAQITDYPRYSYRGVMVDIARHYQSPNAVKKIIDEASASKVNTLHLHVSDDQGFRVVIDGFPNLTNIGAAGSLGTGGKVSDPGGFWTQAQYVEVVNYAASRFMTVIPEVDSPGHVNAIIMSEYNDTENPLLNSTPSDINCSNKKPPVWNYTGAVGYNALCPESDNTWAIMSAIVKQLSAITPGSIYNMGGDEVPTTILAQTRYAAFVNKEAALVKAEGKTIMGWADIAGAGTVLPAGSIAQYWQTASGSSSGSVSGRQAVEKNMKVVMSPANHAYLDMKYAKSVPSVLGQTWACSSGCDIDQFYNWEPSTYVTGVTDDNIIGVEGPLWSETLVTISDVEYMAFPRLLALAELGWSPKVTRTATSPAYLDFLVRVAAQGTRFMSEGRNFYPTAKVAWTLDLNASLPGANADGRDTDGQVAGTFATLSAPGVAASAVTATIDWGDGTSSAGTVAGTAATASAVNGLYAISGSHKYELDGEMNQYQVTITVSTPGKAPVTTVYAFNGEQGAAQQTVVTEVKGAPLSLRVANVSDVVLGAVTLNGEDQIVKGNLNPITVIDPRGTNAGWSLTGQVTEFQGSESGTIAAANLGWSPTAEFVPGKLGLVSTANSTPMVKSGPNLTPGAGLSSAKTLCYASSGASTGKFKCGGKLKLGVPFDTAVGTYKAVLTLTLI